MSIEKNKVVSLTYELRDGTSGGDVIEQIQEAEPFTFLYGAGNLLEEFETNLKELNEGDNFEFTIESNNAYGPVNEQAILDVPKDIFMIEGELADDILFEGNTIPMQDRNGNPMEGRIVSIQEDKVKMDFNHPMAGHDLHFKGKILEIRDASPEEIDHGHAHGPHGHEHDHGHEH